MSRARKATLCIEVVDPQFAPNAEPSAINLPWGDRKHKNLVSLTRLTWPCRQITGHQVPFWYGPSNAETIRSQINHLQQKGRPARTPTSPYLPHIGNGLFTKPTRTTC